jgi:hypothetical protein
MLNGDSYPFFEVRNLLVGHRVSLGNDRDQVDFGVQSAHEFNVNLF